MHNTFATLPPLAMWVFAALLGLPALYDIAVGITSHQPARFFFAIGPLLMAGFLAYCALQRRAGRDARLASREVTLAGYICFGIFAGGFLVKLVLQGTQAIG
jgi:peptidoglycan/LPS O-acetylase OafA/YrhL